MTAPNIVTQLWCWIGTDPSGNERLLSVVTEEPDRVGRALVAFTREDAERMRDVAEAILALSRNGANPLGYVALRQFRMVTQ